MSHCQNASSDSEKAAFFAKYFQTVYRAYDGGDFSEIINNRRDAGFNKIVVTSEAVHSVLSRMNLNKGSSFDGISSLFLRECADLLAKLLSIILVCCVENYGWMD